MGVISLSFVSDGLAISAGVTVCYLVFNFIYNVYFHPLRRFPGPLWWRASRLPFCRELLDGTLSRRTLDLHDQYGKVVRIAPNELSFSDTAAWKDIHGHRTQGELPLEKWKSFYRPMEDLPIDIVNAPREEHAILRRKLAHGFSDRNLREQEPMIAKYIDLFIQRLHGQSEGGKQTVDICAWFNFMTFDVIGDLVFGEPFGCLEQSDLHPWVEAIFQIGYVGVFMHIASHYPLLKKLLLASVPEKSRKERQSHLEFTREKLRHRMSLGENRPDLFEDILKMDLPMDQLEANAGVMIIGGSETTATLLSGLIYFLLTNQQCYKKLKAEIRSAFKSEQDINLQSTNELEYLSACLNEALRLYPPAPNALPRIIPKGGTNIAGQYVPENTVVAINQWATSHSAQHFEQPFAFLPERWLSDSPFKNDHLDAVQPFHLGPRSCLGRNLAYVEMRIVLSRLLWSFDIELAEESRNWIDQKIFLFWKKDALNVRLTKVHS